MKLDAQHAYDIVRDMDCVRLRVGQRAILLTDVMSLDEIINALQEFCLELKGAEDA